MLIGWLKIYANVYLRVIEYLVMQFEFNLFG